MPIHIGDLLRDTGHLRALLMGAYMLLLMHHWSTGSLPDDDAQLSAIARLTPPEWRKAKPILIKFFDEGWHHGRVEEDLASAKASYEKRAKAGAEGGKAKATGKQRSSNATAGPEQPLTFNLKPDTKEESSSLRSEARATRGTRLPDDWNPTPIDEAIALELIGPERTSAELAKFTDHWKQQPGSKGVKLDWAAAWRNWIRRAAEYGGRNGQHSGSIHPNPSAQQSGSTAIFAGVAAATERRARERSSAGQHRPEPPDDDAAREPDPELFGTG